MDGGASENAGVGLTLLHEIAKKLEGRFLIASGRAYYSLDYEGELPNGLEFRGTLCAFSFKRQQIKNFTDLLYGIKEEVGLIKDTSQFNGLFQ